MCVCVCECECVCVCVWGGGGGVFCIVMLEPLSVSFFFFFFNNIFHLDVHYVCMLVQRFEPQGRRFTNVIIISIMLEACHQGL